MFAFSLINEQKIIHNFCQNCPIVIYTRLPQQKHIFDTEISKTSPKPIEFSSSQFSHTKIPKNCNRDCRQTRNMFALFARGAIEEKQVEASDNR